MHLKLETLPHSRCQFQRTQRGLLRQQFSDKPHHLRAQLVRAARSALLDGIGYNYRQMADSGYLWPIVDARIKYIRPTTFGQRLRVTATLAEYENRLKIAYTITDVASGDVVTEATTTQVAVHRERGEMSFVSPPVLIDKVKAALTR